MWQALAEIDVIFFELSKSPGLVKNISFRIRAMKFDDCANFNKLRVTDGKGLLLIVCEPETSHLWLKMNEKPVKAPIFHFSALRMVSYGQHTPIFSEVQYT